MTMSIFNLTDRMMFTDWGFLHTGSIGPINSTQIIIDKNTPLKQELQIEEKLDNFKLPTGVSRSKTRRIIIKRAPFLPRRTVLVRANQCK
jgi:hypothetical protein